MGAGSRLMIFGGRMTERRGLFGFQVEADGELARAAGRLAGNGSGFGLMPSGCVLDPQKERLPAIIKNGRQPCYADAYLAKSRYKSLYCFAEFSQDTSLSISRCTISSQHQRFSK